MGKIFINVAEQDCPVIAQKVALC